MIKVLLADDQSILADGLKSVLESCPDITVVGVAKDGFEAVTLAGELQPDVVLMDIRMPNMNGVIATREIKRDHPDVKVLVLTTFDDSDYILSAINNGASGYLLKDTSSAALIDAIKNAHAGDTILPAKVARRIVGAARWRSPSCSAKGSPTSRSPPRSNLRTALRATISPPFTKRQRATAATPPWRK